MRKYICNIAFHLHQRTNFNPSEGQSHRFERHRATQDRPGPMKLTLACLIIATTSSCVEHPGARDPATASASRAPGGESGAAGRPADRRSLLAGVWVGEDDTVSSVTIRYPNGTY